MSTITLPAVKPYHIITLNGALVSTGAGPVLFEHGRQEIFWFDTELERDEDARAITSRAQTNIVSDTIKHVELPKSPQAYAAMRQDALDWLRAERAGTAEWDAELYPALAITVECCNMTPTDAAQAINAAVKTNVLDPERVRTIKREELSTLANTYINGA